MKIMYVDVLLDGHHLSYLNALLHIEGNEYVIAIPEKVKGLDCKQYTFSKMDFYHKTLYRYFKWLREIYVIALREQPDVIHFLYGDVFYKYFGSGLGKFKRHFKTVVTIHGLRKGLLARIGLLLMFRLCNVGVVHTDIIRKQIAELKITNLVHIEYPHFSRTDNISSIDSISSLEAKKSLGIPSDRKVLGCLGATRKDKGLDILLKALQNVHLDFELLIAGAEEAVSQAEISRLCKPYASRVHMLLRYLTDEEFDLCLAASDIVVLPYRREFNGASGPLGEGVWLYKPIIGPDHGSLGDIIKNNHIGYVFETENEVSLAQTISTAVTCPFLYDETAIKYRMRLSVERFQKEYQYSVYKTTGI